MTAPDGPVTAVVCAYTERRFADTAAALDSLARQTRRPDAILLVVDHNPDLAARARAELGVRVVENHHRRGLSGARNTALDVLRDEAGDAGDATASGIVASSGIR